MRKLFRAIAGVITIAMIIMPLTACDSLSSGKETSQNLTQAETVFEVAMAQPIGETDKLYLEMVDEVTGIALHPVRYEMEDKDSLSYFVRIPLVIGSLIKYRYVRESSGILIEYDTQGNSIRYRLHEVNAPAVVKDFIVGWSSSAFTGQTGEISGYVYDMETEAPLAEIMISINGIQAFTSSDGYYELTNIPLGEYDLVAIHPDGKYQVFQQGAVIADNSVTPASFGMTAADTVEVTFVLSVPEGTKTGSPIRLLSNLYSLGNTFSELNGGTSVISSQAPLMSYQDNGQYTLTLELPEGLDFRYKYSLGDGFINAEHDQDGSYRTRQLVIPATNQTVKNTVSTWFSKGDAPVTFHVTVPQNTPENDLVSIQFNPFVWMEPITMQKESANQWTFTLYSPQEYLNNAQFRFCRNYRCGLADDELTSGDIANGYILDLSGTTVQYNLQKWAGLDDQGYSFQLGAIPTTNNIYIKAIQFDKDFNKKYLSTTEWGLVDAAVSGANMVILTPTWTFNVSPTNEQIGPKSGKDILMDDLAEINQSIQAAGLTPALYPQPRFYSTPSDYWLNSKLDYTWWQDWFKKYERMVLNYADYAELNGITTLIIGGSDVAPAFPNGILPNGKSANTPYDFKDKWSALIDSIKTRFHGQLFFALPYSSSLDNLPDFISKTDAVYIEFSSALTASKSPSVNEIRTRFSQILDSEVYKLYATYQKPIILGIDYPSIDGTGTNCLDTGRTCNDYLVSQNNGFSSVDLNEQAVLYQAIIEESLQRNWIYGLVSEGYDPSVVVQDHSASIRGKPTMSVLAQYFTNIVR